MSEFGICATERHELLNGFYEVNGLEITEDEPVSTDTVKSFVIMPENFHRPEGCGDILDGAASAPAAACTLAYRQGEYIIDGIAVTSQLRGKGAGSALLAAAEAEAAERGGSRVYLVARAPGFFRENGYETVERKDAPEFFECFGCDQYGKTCHPEVMRHVL